MPEAHRLEREVEVGCVEYKQQLVNPDEKRLQRLITQMNFRLDEGSGAALYVIGVADDGCLTGLDAKAMDASLETLGRMAAALGATWRVQQRRTVHAGLGVAEVLVHRPGLAFQPLGVLANGSTGASAMRPAEESHLEVPFLPEDLGEPGDPGELSGPSLHQP